MDKELQSILRFLLVFSILIACGMFLQARWDKQCGEGRRWDGDLWMCIDRDS